MSVLFSLFVSDIPKPKGNVILAQFADDIVVWLILLYMWNRDLEIYENKILNGVTLWSRCEPQKDKAHEHGELQKGDQSKQHKAKKIPKKLNFWDLRRS